MIALRTLLVAVAASAASLTAACRDVHAPLRPEGPREAASVTGTMDVAGRAADITECVSRRSTSKDGIEHGVRFVAPQAGFALDVEDDPKPARLDLGGGDGGEPRVVTLAKPSCTEYVVSFFERARIVHGSVRFDCQTPDGRVQVRASFDDCGGG